MFHDKYIIRIMLKLLIILSWNKQENSVFICTRLIYMCNYWDPMVGKSLLQRLKLVRPMLSQSFIVLPHFANLFSLASSSKVTESSHLQGQGYCTATPMLTNAILRTSPLPFRWSRNCYLQAQKTDATIPSLSLTLCPILWQ